MFELGGLCGSLTAGWASDKLFQARRSPINILFAIGMALSVLFIWWLPPGTAYLDFLAIFVIGFLLFLVLKCLSGIVSHGAISQKSISNEQRASLAWFAYLRARLLTGYPLGKITKTLWGWDGFSW